METPYTSKPHYEVLDGLRGVAAMMVVAFHLCETYSLGSHIDQYVNHGYLAVDFFFALSGFVIGYAYDDRWGTMTVGQFFKRRLKRLHPMLVIGTVIGALLYYFGAGDVFPAIARTPWWKVLAVMLICCTIIPVPRSLDIRGWGETNPLNGPAWTLQWEYVANILYAAVFRRCGKRVLAACVGLFACLTVLLTMNIDLFGLLAARAGSAYTVIGGWSLSPTQLYVGASRLLYPFFAGLLLSRCGKVIRMRNGFLWCSAAIVVLLAMPFVGNHDIQWTNGLYECVCILLLFPLIVATGAGSRVTGKRASAACKFLGDISFPLYITHYPLIYLHTAWAPAHADLPLGTHIFVSVSVFLLAVGIACASLKLWDTPVRRWLDRK